MRPTPPLFSPFGWSVAGALLLGLSLPPTGFYPLAWVALVPVLIRWRLATSVRAYAREAYAVFLVLSCSAGFWLLFHPDPTRAALGGLGLLVVPLPLTIAFVAALPVRTRFGLTAGMAALVVNVLAMEYLMLHMPGGIPWLLLGHTQAASGAFAQQADLGGVLLLSVWVLGLNVAASLAVSAQRHLPAGDTPPVMERGAAIAVFAVVLVAPVLYGASRAADPARPVGFVRIGIVQPGLSPDVWDEQSPTDRVDYLADLSGSLLERWRGGTLESGNIRPTSSGLTGGLLVWPQGAIPDMGDRGRSDRLIERLGVWCGRQNVDLLAGATMASAARRDAWSQTDADAAASAPPARSSGNAAILIRRDRPTVRYDQMRRLPLADPHSPMGTSRVLFTSGGARLATALGFESVFGDHMRTFALQGADAFLVLSQSDWWGRTGGAAQQLAITQLRAIETRRSIVVTTVGGGASLIDPSGRIEPLADWMKPALVPLDVALYRGSTVYTRHGDWLGVIAIWLALLGNVGAWLAAKILPPPEAAPRRRSVWA